MITEFKDGAVWDVLSIPRYKNGKRYGDGDTVRLVRTGIFRLGDKRFRLTDVDPLGESIRLIWVDTPERGQPGYVLAGDEFSAWIDRKLALGPLKVVCFDSGGWDRMLGDLLAVDGESAAQWMLTQGNGGHGWPPYIEGQ